jgi:hypothetical protein
MYMFNVTPVVLRVYKTYSSTMYYRPVYDRWVTSISSFVWQTCANRGHHDYDNPIKLPYAMLSRL